MRGHLTSRFLIISHRLALLASLLSSDAKSLFMAFSHFSSNYRSSLNFLENTPFLAMMSLANTGSQFVSCKNPVRHVLNPVLGDRGEQGYC